MHSVSRKNDAWVAQLEYGTTGLYLNSLAGVVEESDGQLTLRFVTPLASAVRLTLRSDTLLRGTFRLPTEDQDRPIELKRVARGGEPVPSTALDRVGKAARAAGRHAVGDRPARAGRSRRRGRRWRRRSRPSSPRRCPRS